MVEPPLCASHLRLKYVVNADDNLVQRGHDSFRYDGANRLLKCKVHGPTFYSYL